MSVFRGTGHEPPTREPGTVATPQIEFLLAQPEITRRIYNIRIAQKDWNAGRDITAIDVFDLCCRMGTDLWASLYARDVISLEVFEAILDVMFAHERNQGEA